MRVAVEEVEVPEQVDLRRPRTLSLGRFRISFAKASIPAKSQDAAAREHLAKDAEIQSEERAKTVWAQIDETSDCPFDN